MDKKILDANLSIGKIMGLQSGILKSWSDSLYAEENVQSAKDINLLFEKIRHANANRRNIFFTGIGKNVPMLIKSTSTMKSLSISAFTFNAVDAVHGDMGILRENDLLISVSKSGNTDELFSTMLAVKTYKPLVQTFCVSMNHKASIFEHTKYSVALPKIKEIDNWDLVPTTSALAFQIVFDSIAIRIAYENKFNTVKFFENHSAGQIGTDIVNKYKMI